MSLGLFLSLLSHGLLQGCILFLSALCPLHLIALLEVRFLTDISKATKQMCGFIGMVKFDFSWDGRFEVGASAGALVTFCALAAHL